MTLASFARARKYSRVDASPVTLSTRISSRDEFRYPAASRTTFDDGAASVVEAISSERNDEVVARDLSAFNFADSIPSYDDGPFDDRVLRDTHSTGEY